jgi:hypothetical protein
MGNFRKSAEYTTSGQEAAITGSRVSFGVLPTWHSFDVPRACGWRMGLGRCRPRAGGLSVCCPEHGCVQPEAARVLKAAWFGRSSIALVTRKAARDTNVAPFANCCWCRCRIGGYETPVAVGGRRPVAEWTRIVTPQSRRCGDGAALIGKCFRLLGKW